MAKKRRREKGPYRPGKGQMKLIAIRTLHSEIFKLEGNYYVHGQKVGYREIRKFIRGFCLRKTLRVIKVSSSFFENISLPAEYTTDFLYLKNGSGQHFLFGPPADSRVIEKKYPLGLHPEMDVIKIAADSRPS